jgi:flagellar basal body-associated protein FliL
MSVGKPEFQQQDTEFRAAKPSKKRRCMAHCKRFWWIYLIVFICVVVLVVCLIIFVAVPKIAQSKVNDSELEIDGVNIINTESDSYTMEINSTIRTDGSIHAEIDGFTGELYLEDSANRVPFATIDFPATSAKKEEQVNVSQSITITNMDAFIEYNIWFVNNETLKLTVEGKTKVKPSGLSRKYEVDFKKTLDVTALNLLQGTEVTEGHIEIEEDDQGRNFYGKSNIPNPSHFTLEIGNVTFANFIGDERVGTLYIDDLVLRPGDNLVDISATMDQFTILSLVRSPEYCEEGIIPFKLLGENVTNNGQNIPYFLAGLASANQTVPIDIASIIEKSLNTTVGCSDD